MFLRRLARSSFLPTPILLCETSPDQTPHPRLGQRVPSLPNYTFSEIAAHKKKNESVWVTYREGVYDVTDFVAKHPGGDKIMLGAGGAVDPFWRLYGQHESLPHIGHMLEQMRIGNIDAAEWEARQKEPSHDTSDPYHVDRQIGRHPGLVFLTERPANAECPPSLLADTFLTPNEVFFVRHHFPVPKTNGEEEVTVSIGGDLLGDGVELFQPTSLAPVELSRRFTQYSVIATIQCTGNRRTGFKTVVGAPGEVKGLPWTIGAISTAQWEGPKLRDVLLGMFDGDEDKLRKTGVRHVQFWGRDSDGSGQFYGVSIPIDRALDPRSDVILALKMNGEKLPLDHGAPVRVIVPGAAGCRSVKWLDRIELAKSESCAFWQKEDYKSFSPSQGWTGLDFSTAPAVMSTPVQSAVCEARRDEEYVLAKGYAFSGGGNRVIRVDVSVDGGKTWEVADIETEMDQVDDSADPPFRRTYSWTLWKAVVKIPDSGYTGNVIVKAVDETYNSQPETAASIWNVRGILNNSWHSVAVE
jgi:sulfite oxidase